MDLITLLLPTVLIAFTIIVAKLARRFSMREYRRIHRANAARARRQSHHKPAKSVDKKELSKTRT